MDPKVDLKNVIAQALKNGTKFINKRDSKLHKVIRYVLLILSFGQMDQYKNYATTIGRTIGLPENFEQLDDLQKLALVEHELVHVKQYNKWGILFMLSYLLFPLPIGFAYFRWVWEREAYLTTLRVLNAYKDPNVMWWVDYIVWNMSGPPYLWAWPFKGSMKKWLLMRLIGGVK